MTQELDLGKGEGEKAWNTMAWASKERSCVSWQRGHTHSVVSGKPPETPRASISVRVSGAILEPLPSESPAAPGLAFGILGP